MTRQYPCPPIVFSRDVLRMISSMHVSPVSPGFLNRPSQDAPQFPPEGVLLPTSMDDFSDSDLGVPIAYAQCELFPGSDTPMSLPVFSVPSGFYARPDQSSVQSVLALGTSFHPDRGSSAVAPSMDMEDGPLLETGLPGCPFRFTPYSGQPFADGNPAFGLQLHHPRFLEFVGSPLVPFTNVLGESTRKRTSDGRCCQPATRPGIMLSNLQILSQFATSLSHMSSEMMDLGIGQMVFPHDEVAGQVHVGHGSVAPSDGSG